MQNVNTAAGGHDYTFRLGVVSESKSGNDRRAPRLNNTAAQRDTIDSPLGRTRRHSAVKRKRHFNGKSTSIVHAISANMVYVYTAVYNAASCRHHRGGARTTAR